jgi:deoxycytidylate deaminase
LATRKVTRRSCLLPLPLDNVIVALDNALASVAYECFQVQLSKLLPGSSEPSSDEYERLKNAMDKGNELRAKLKRTDAVVALAVAAIQKHPQRRDSSSRRAFVIRSLKHPDEVRRLRSIYRGRLVVIGVHTPTHERMENLKARIARSRGERANQKEIEDQARELMGRDEREPENRFGQSVRDTFPLADIFVSTTKQIEHQLHRLIGLIFGRPVITPTRDEASMYHADAASLRSGAMGRQVGAVVASGDGDILSLGCNEVPKAFGGQYWDGDEPDGRDFFLGADRSDQGKRQVLHQIMEKLNKNGLLRLDTTYGASVSELMENSMAGKVPDLRDTSVMDLTEFTRDVHAESAAIVNASRLGMRLDGGTLYVTTYPCHNCTKHILAAGLRRVFYIEPYVKSYARDFYRESIEIEKEDPCKISFLPFVGVAPRSYARWFRMQNRRKDHSGKRVLWAGRTATPLFDEFGANSIYTEADDLTYQDRESYFLNKVSEESKGARQLFESDLKQEEGSYKQE